MKSLLWLDDVRDPMSFSPAIDMINRFGIDEVIWAKDFDMFKTLFPTRRWEVVSFDHDLGFGPDFDENGRERNGVDCARWMVEFCLANEVAIPYHEVHSANPVGRQNIESVIRSGRKVETLNPQKSLIEDLNVIVRRIEDHTRTGPDTFSDLGVDLLRRADNILQYLQSQRQ